MTLFHAADKKPFIGADAAAGRTAALLSYWGFLGVYLFFVLSGFCIHMRWAKQKAAGREPCIDFIPFWQRRFRRLYPTYVVALVVYLLIAHALRTLNTSAFLWVDIGVHLLMLHNIMPITTFSLNGVFWTLAIEEQLYLAYFLLLRLRNRFGWARTLAITLAARAGWLALGMLLHRRFGLDITVLEAAAALWFCWALGAVSVEAHFGVITLPRWCRSWLSATLLLGLSVAAGNYFHHGPPTGFGHHTVGLVAQPLYSLAFFVVVNCLVRSEARLAARRGVTMWLARLGLISYSLYLTHEIVLTQFLKRYAAWVGWSDGHRTLVAVLVGTPLSIAFATLFFYLFERPFLAKIPRGPRPREVVATG